MITISLFVFVFSFGNACDRGLFPHEDIDGSVKCCKRIWCDRGHFPLPCSNGTSTLCKECPDGTFIPKRTQSDLIHNCFSRRRCDRMVGMTTIHNGSTYENSVCGCNHEMGFVPMENIHSERRHKVANIDQDALFCIKQTCPDGTQITKYATCKPCPYGTFRKSKAWSRCHPWTNCTRLGLITEVIGNETTDSVCLSNSSETINYSVLIVILLQLELFTNCKI